MRWRAVLIVFVIALTGMALAQKKNKKPVFPAWITQARYVYVTTVYGDPWLAANFTDIPTEDRKAAFDVQDALKKWGRFVLVYRPDEADVILVVRKGKVAAATGRSTVGIRPRNPGTVTTDGTLFGVEAGNPDDVMLVYDGKLGTDRTAALKYIEKGGLDAPDVTVVAEFRKQVEEASAKKP
jgi:hypothetical protein